MRDTKRNVNLRYCFSICHWTQSHTDQFPAGFPWSHTIVITEGVLLKPRSHNPIATGIREFQCTFVLCKAFSTFQWNYEEIEQSFDQDASVPWSTTFPKNILWYLSSREAGTTKSIAVKLLKFRSERTFYRLSSIHDQTIGRLWEA